ncbi:hypothetical protein TRV_00803 [Trichophyton verrucosum HKI 0517]|uniref:Uncharacterized protein n=1 Tax=Trichophyton verrucosum (strain HKI 0517) TaxID=663202 RepID=D4D156_TRIVH|nr:uncharacterized protein TRV_00803 [Trichophyton verrucosum HKI 0517]EFE44388.1 hypothetical protein TRV_00803 [Trichophyton verrucosum HKI 0517]
MINNSTVEKEESIQKPSSQDEERKLTIKEKKSSLTAASLAFDVDVDVDVGLTLS